MKRDKGGRPTNLDGSFADAFTEDGYTRYFAGPAEVRFHPGYEPDGELVTRERVHVHAERMDAGLWAIILTAPDGHDIHISLSSKARIRVLWRDEP